VSVADDERLPHQIAAALAGGGLCVFLTGAGISAESGVPTFRGKDGYWVVGSRNYHAQELATRAAFSTMPEAVWGWYLHRLRICNAALPNAAHRAIAEVAAPLADRFLLITQNVDGLHERAGTPVDRSYEIHGNISLMRCSRGCKGLSPVPSSTIDASASPAHLRATLRCSACGAWARPHVLWFDELYDEPLFRFESSLAAIERASLLVVVGTTGGTNLPAKIGDRAARRGVPIVVINPEPNPFSELVACSPGSAYLEGLAGQWVPRVTHLILEALSSEHGGDSGRGRPGLDSGQ
jgi:NAD-dependent protein deacetylase/lipoamidase